MIWRSPVGPLEIVVSGDDVEEIRFAHDAVPANDCRGAVIDQLSEYFAGKRTSFDLRLRPKGTPFQLAVWSELQKIPYGETRTYAEIAAAIGRPRAVRAVGAANGANPIPLVIPCHRVIGSDGSLTGFGGGIDMKRALLALEAGQAPLA